MTEKGKTGKTPRREKAGGRLKAARVGKKMKMREVAEMAGISISQVSNMESGASMSIDSLLAVCEVLEVGLDEVLK